MLLHKGRIEQLAKQVYRLQSLEMFTVCPFKKKFADSWLRLSNKYNFSQRNRTYGCWQRQKKIDTKDSVIIFWL